MCKSLFATFLFDTFQEIAKLFSLHVSHLILFLRIVLDHLEPESVCFFCLLHPMVAINEEVVATVLHDEVGICLLC